MKSVMRPRQNADAVPGNFISNRRKALTRPTSTDPLSFFQSNLNGAAVVQRLQALQNIANTSAGTDPATQTSANFKGNR